MRVNRRGAAARARTTNDARPARPPPPPAESPRVEPFDVEYYRTLSGGNPAEVFKAAMFTPALQPRHVRRTPTLKKH